MELQGIFSDFLTTAMIILLASTILYPLTLSLALGADRWLARRGVCRGRGLWRRFAAGERSSWTTTSGDAHHRGVPAAQLIGGAAPDEGPERRRHIRLKTPLLGTLHRDTAAAAGNLCDVVDLSASGARIRPVDPLPEVPLLALGLEHFGLFAAQIVWRDHDEVGLRFLQSPTEVARLMRGLLPAPGHAPAAAACAA